MSNKKNNEQLQFVAGQLWALRDDLVSVRSLPLNEHGSEARKQRIHLAVANAICGCPSLLTGGELVFLCKLTDVKYAEVARYLAVNRSNMTLWTRGDRPMPRQESIRLKKWFWLRLFREGLGDHFGPVETAVVFDDHLLLQYLKHLAISRGLALTAEAVATHGTPLASMPLARLEGGARRRGASFLNS